MITAHFVFIVFFLSSKDKISFKFCVLYFTFLKVVYITVVNNSNFFRCLHWSSNLQLEMGKKKSHEPTQFYHCKGYSDADLLLQYFVHFHFIKQPVSQTWRTWSFDWEKHRCFVSEVYLSVYQISMMEQEGLNEDL